ncbi:hypothetical protein ACWEA7_45965, partial [Streptomyces sp. NPDC005093]
MKMVLPGRQLTGDERAALAACLDVPTETAIALTFTVRICDAEPFTGWDRDTRRQCLRPVREAPGRLRRVRMARLRMERR